MWSAPARPDIEGIGPLVIGVDPKREGNDRFSIAWRKGRKVEKVESDAKPIETMAAARSSRTSSTATIRPGCSSTLAATAPASTTCWSLGREVPQDRPLVNFGSSPFHPPPRDKDGKEMAGYSTAAPRCGAVARLAEAGRRG
jgi:hypothetical protein